MRILKTEKIFVGVDVSKLKLDIFHPDSGELVELENTENAVEAFCRLLAKKKMSIMVAWKPPVDTKVCC